MTDPSVKLIARDSQDDLKNPPAKRARLEPPSGMTEKVESISDSGSDFYNTPLNAGTPMHTTAYGENEAPSVPSTPQKPHPPIPGLGLCNPSETDAQAPPVGEPLESDLRTSALREVMTATEITPANEASATEQKNIDADNATNNNATAPSESKDVDMKEGPASNGNDVQLETKNAQTTEGPTSNGGTNADPALLVAQNAAQEGESPLPEVPVAGEQPEENGEPEWEVDSSPYESSSESSSSDSSSDDEDDEYKLLDPEEQARLLMETASDDEGGKEGKRDVRTANEKDEDVLPIPDITVTADTKIEMLGNIETIVDNIALVKANISGEYQVLETGSALCLANLKVIGVVSETLGKVEQPLYTVRFKSTDDLKEMGIEKGIPVFYVVEHSTFVFTQPLKGLKGSDASNFYDEEVGEHEVEFSDDEAEAEYKRQLKQKRLEKRGEGDRVDRGNRRGRGRGQPRPSGLRNSELNYDEVPMEDGYTPLARPKNFHEMMGGQEAPLETPRFQGEKPFSGRGRGRDRGNDRGGRGRGRGGGYQHQSDGHQRRTHEQRDSTKYTPPASNQNPNQPFQQSGHQQPGAPFNSQASQQYNYFQSAQMPQGGGFPNPLPMQFPHQAFPFILPYQQQQAFQFPPPGSHINPAFFANLQAQVQQPQQQQPQLQPQPQQPPSSQTPRSETQSTSDTFAAAQAQLDLLRRLSHGNSGA